MAWVAIGRRCDSYIVERRADVLRHGKGRDMIPQIGEEVEAGEEVEFDEEPYPSLTYRLTDNQIVGRVDELDAIQQAVLHILATERGAFPIYDEDYGVELEQYLGQSFSYLEATIQRTFEEALTQDDRIESVDVENIELVEQGVVSMLVTVHTNMGSVEAEKRVFF